MPAKILGKIDTNTEKKGAISERTKAYLKPNLETSSLFKSSNFVHIAKSRKHLRQVSMTHASDSIKMIE